MLPALTNAVRLTGDDAQYWGADGWEVLPTSAHFDGVDLIGADSVTLTIGRNAIEIGVLVLQGIACTCEPKGQAFHQRDCPYAKDRTGSESGTEERHTPEHVYEESGGGDCAVCGHLPGDEGHG